MAKETAFTVEIPASVVLFVETIAMKPKIIVFRLLVATATMATSAMELIDVMATARVSVLAIPALTVVHATIKFVASAPS